MKPDLSALVALLPAKWQTRAKAVASAVVVLLGSVLPLLVLAGVNLPVAVAAAVPAVLAALTPLVVYAVPNAPSSPSEPVPTATD